MDRSEDIENHGEEKYPVIEYGFCDSESHEADIVGCEQDVQDAEIFFIGIVRFSSNPHLMYMLLLGVTCKSLIRKFKLCSSFAEVNEEIYVVKNKFS